LKYPAPRHTVTNETKAFHVEAYFSNNKQSTIKERQKKTYNSNETKAFHVEAYFSNNKQSSIKERQKKTKGSTGI
jgi:hypothetical protein